MNSSDSNLFRGLLQAGNQWLKRTPERALDEAYEAALKIKSIEDTHFDGGLITGETGNYSDSVRSLFQRDLNLYLETIKVRLIEFKASNSVVKIVDLARPPEQNIQLDDTDSDNNDIQTIDVIDEQNIRLKKLQFIDEIRTRYRPTRAQRQQANASASATRKRDVSPMLPINPSFQGRPNNIEQMDATLLRRITKRSFESDTSAQSFADKTGVVPRSILRTVDRIKRDLDPDAENEVVEEFRESKARTSSAIYFILLLIVVPLLTQQVSKNFIIGPLVDHFRGAETVMEVMPLAETDEGIPGRLFLNDEMDEEAIAELQRYHERLEFQVLIGQVPPLSEEDMQEKIHDKAVEIYENFHHRSSDALTNVFSDFLSLVAFALVIMGSQREIEVLKSFIDEVVYGLSDSAKAFIIILLTDTFVGFHSPHGWEILLEGIARHFGLPASRDFIFLFIATFPVVLDTIFKYWIFRYLNRISPSAVATYKNMNE